MLKDQLHRERSESNLTIDGKVRGGVCVRVFKQVGVCAFLESVCVCSSRSVCVFEGVLRCVCVCVESCELDDVFQ